MTSLAASRAPAVGGPGPMVRAQPGDLVTGSRPLAFTFGLGGLLLFPLRIGASTLLLERPSPEVLLPAVAAERASVLVTAPTSSRAMAAHAHEHDLSSLRKCVSAGEALPAATRRRWKDDTGDECPDGHARAHTDTTGPTPERGGSPQPDPPTDGAMWLPSLLSWSKIAAAGPGRTWGDGKLVRVFASTTGQAEGCALRERVAV